MGATRCSALRAIARTELSCPQGSTESPHYQSSCADARRRRSVALPRRTAARDRQPEPAALLGPLPLPGAPERRERTLAITAAWRVRHLHRAGRRLAAVWAAVLGAGSGAAASHATALWLGGVIDDRPDVIHISIPAERRVRSHPGVRIHRTRDFSDSVHPAALPPRSRVECAVLDVSETAGPVVVVDIVLRSIQRRLTTALRLRAALSSRPRHRHRWLLQEVLDEAGSGVHSQLERRYLRDVERRHRLPSGRRNRAERGSGGSDRYRDVRYRPWLTVVELDGRAAHPADEAFRDHRRDKCRCSGRRRRAPLRLA